LRACIASISTAQKPDWPLWRASLCRIWARQLRLIFSALMALLTALNAGAGQEQSKPPRSFHQITPGNFVVDTDGRAKQIVDEILKLILGVTSTSWSVWVSDDQLDTSNAVSKFYPPPDSQREIIFNRSFLAAITSGTDKWPAYCVAAHEIGHIIRLHLENANLDTAKKLKAAELEADYYCGFVLGKMGASYEAAASAIRWYQPSANLNYPTREERIAQIGRGWVEATGSPIVTVAVTIPAAAPSAAAATNSVRRTDDATKGPTPQPTTTTQNRSLVNYSLKDNRDIGGRDIDLGSPYGRLGIPGVTLQACAQACDTRKQCKAFSFDRWNSRCFLKDAIVTSVLNPSSTIGAKKPAALPNASTVEASIEKYSGKRFRDPPISRAITASFQACRDSCQGEIKCVALSFLKKARANEPNCEMFKKSDGYYNDPDADSGVKRQPSQ